MLENFLIFLQSIDHWDWFIFSLLCLVLEVYFRRGFFLWLGISTGTIGVIVTFSPVLSWKIQLIMFAAGFLFSLFAMFNYLIHCPDESNKNI